MRFLFQFSEDQLFQTSVSHVFMFCILTGTILGNCTNMFVTFFPSNRLLVELYLVSTDCGYFDYNVIIIQMNKSTPLNLWFQPLSLSNWTLGCTIESIFRSKSWKHFSLTTWRKKQLCLKKKMDIKMFSKYKIVLVSKLYS